MEKETSLETQQLLISTFLKGKTKSNLYEQAHSLLNDTYFSDPICKMIYKAIQSYFTRYNNIPTYREVLSQIELVYSNSFGIPIQDVMSQAEKLSDDPEIDPDVSRETLTRFIRNYRMNMVLKNTFEKIKENPNMQCTDTILKDINDALDFTITVNEPIQITAESWAKARLEALGNNSKPIRSFFGTINNVLNEGGWSRGTLNMIVGPPGTGKSMWLINEGAYALQQGYKVLHLIIGDMTDLAVITRYISKLSTVKNGILGAYTQNEMEATINGITAAYGDILPNLRILTFPSYSITPDQLIPIVEKIKRKDDIEFDMIIIDYPDNCLKQTKNGSLYEDGGIVYGILEKLAKETKAVVMVASQPKITYYNDEIISLDGAAESSRKQQIVDTMITYNAHNRQHGTNFGSALLAKTRGGGGTGRIIRWKSNLDNCNIEEITEDEYRQMLQEYETQYGNEPKPRISNYGNR